MYLLAEKVSDEWRALAAKLGLTPADMAEIAKRVVLERPREKCMHVLYKWRLLVPLKEFKVTTLVQACKESKLYQVAVGEDNNEKIYDSCPFLSCSCTSTIC
jgi:hypothetical protein